MPRRDFLATSGGATLALALPAMPLLGPRPAVDPVPTLTLRDPRIKALAHTALDAAKSEGATYADVRLTYRTRREFMSGQFTKLDVDLGISVRALSQGYWGWAATPYLSEADVARIGREAVRLAKGEAARGKPRTVEWAPVPVVSDGDWHTPIRIDPFEVALEELSDYMVGLIEFTMDNIKFRQRGHEYPANMIHQFGFFQREERVFASTDGSYLTQTGHTIHFHIDYTYKYGGNQITLGPWQGGWDVVLDAKLREQILQQLDDYDHPKAGEGWGPLRKQHLLNMGRYDIVFTARTMAQLLAGTLAPATQLDRALGYEANAGGTSYLGPDPLAYLGTPVASPLVTVTGDRSQPRGLASIGWDEEGVVPESFPLVKEGVLVDYQTTREQAAWLAPWYHKQGQPLRSRGCAAGDGALSLQMQHPPNLTLEPGAAAVSVTDLVAGMDQGLLVDGIRLEMDFQNASGVGTIGEPDVGAVYEVKHGKVVSQYETVMEVQFRSAEFWKGIIAIGGPASAETLIRGRSEKGEPSEQTDYSIAAVPAVCKQLAVSTPPSQRG